VVVAAAAAAAAKEGFDGVVIMFVLVMGTFR
jgi:hypothetical protein